MKQHWLVAGNDLRTRERRGGRVALNGFDFQAVHAVNLISQLLTFEQGLVQVRYEGAQDIDLMFGDGRQVFIQLKDTPQDKYSIKLIRGILHGFMKDAIDACGNTADLTRLAQLKLEFVLVTTGTISGLDAVKILNRTHTLEVSKLVADKFIYDRNPLTTANARMVAAYVLRNLTVRLVPADSANRDQTLAAIGRLSLFGISPADIENSINNIRQLLTPPGEYSAADAYLCMSGLSNDHPVTGRNGIVALPGINKQPNLEIAQKEFKESGRTSWASIYHQLDVVRDVDFDLRKAVEASLNSAFLVVLIGPSGSGKSTAVKRLAWDLHVSGAALVFEVLDSEKINESTWDEVLRIASLARKPAVFVVDDLGEHRRLLEHLARNPSASVKVLASNQTHCIPANFSVPAFQQMMPPISTAELQRLAERLDKKPPGNTETDRLTNFLDSRDIFSISLALQGTNRQSLAQSYLSKVTGFIPELRELFLGICACGMHDQSVPKTLLLRSDPQQSTWEKAIQERLLFEIGADRVRSVHASLAKCILDQAKADPLRAKLRFLEIIDPKIAFERRFGLGLLKDACKLPRSKLAMSATSLEPFGEAIMKHGDYLDLDRCANIFESLITAGAINLTPMHAQLLRTKQPDRVRTGYDAVLFMSEWKEPVEVFEVVEQLLSKNDAPHGRNAFMRWITDKGRTYPRWHILAIEQHFDWVRKHNFPHPETLSLINCITHGNPDLHHDDRMRLIDILEIVLIRGVFIESRKQPVIDLLLSRIAESIYTRLREDSLFTVLLDGLESRADIKLLSGSVELCKGLAKAARLAGSTATRSRTLQILKRSLAESKSTNLIPIGMTMLGLLPASLDSDISAWGKILNRATQDEADAFLKQFVGELESRMLI